MTSDHTPIIEPTAAPRVEEELQPTVSEEEPSPSVENPISLDELETGAEERAADAEEIDKAEELAFGGASTLDESLGEDSDDCLDEDAYEDSDEELSEGEGEDEDLRRRHERLTQTGQMTASFGGLFKGRMDYIGFSVWVIFLILLVHQWQTAFENKIRSIDRLEKRVEDVRYRHLFISAELVRLERISSVEANVSALGLDLEHSTTPPYEIKPTPTEKP